ncbi:MAG TPA: RodZ domain-containing protein [Coriobacteriia bacterium]
MTTVGEILAAERRRQGKTMADVVEGTKIRSRLLDALEQGDYDSLPSNAYVKGYIQSYARYLEIPAEPLLEQFKRESADTVRRASPTERYLENIPQATVVPRREKAHEIPRKIWVAVAAGVVLVLLVLCAIVLINGRSNAADTTPATAPSGEMTASPGATGSPAATTTAVTNGTGFKLRVSIRAGLASYVKVTFDGLTAFNATMQGGESHEWAVTRQAEIIVGKPDAVVITRDGQAVSIPKTANAKIDLSATE